MTTSIDRVETDVIAEPEPPPGNAGTDNPWAEQEHLEALLARHRLVLERLSAEGFDD